MNPAASESPGHARRLAHALLFAAFLLLAVRLAGFAARFGDASLQMDLAAFYTAGQSVAAGLSPYENHVERDPPIWDGVSVFRHSRFLHPPLAASAFRLLVLVPYHAAKLLWMAASLVALLASVVLAARLAGASLCRTNVLVLGVVVCSFHPLLALLERGQIDAFTLLLVMLALTLMQPGVPRKSIAAGGLLALAALFKPSCAFLLPFLLLRGRWRVAGGFLAGGLLLLGLDLAVGGPARVAGYALREVPRISRHGEGGTRAMALPGAAFREVLQGIEPGKTVMDGRQYATSGFRFVLNAGLSQAWPGDVVRRAATAIGMPEPKLSHVALSFLAAFVLAFALLQRGRAPATDGSGEFAYWLSALVVVLLCGPVTWAMNAVWLLTLAPLILLEVRRLRSVRHAAAVFFCALGMLIAGAPDPYGFAVLWPFDAAAWNAKYVVAELACLAGLAGLWRDR
jgi:hypothetical protein